MDYKDVTFFCLDCGKKLSEEELKNEIKYYGYLCNDCNVGWVEFKDKLANMSYTPDEVKQFIIAVRRKASGDIAYAKTTQKSFGRLRSEITKRLRDPDKRISVLAAITGLPITSQKQLTQHWTSVLIDEVVNDSKKFDITISFTEGFIEGQTGIVPWRIYPWESPAEIDMSDMPETDEINT